MVCGQCITVYIYLVTADLVNIVVISWLNINIWVSLSCVPAISYIYREYFQLGHLCKMNQAPISDLIDVTFIEIFEIFRSSQDHLKVSNMNVSTNDTNATLACFEAYDLMNLPSKLVASAVIGGVATVLNAFVFFVIITDETLRIVRPVWLILNQCVADFSTGVVVFLMTCLDTGRSRWAIF